MRLQYKGSIKFSFLRKLLNSRDYRNHTVEDGIYTLHMVKNTFKIIPRSVVYYDVFIMRGIMCGDGKEAYREPEYKPEVRPRTAEELYTDKTKKTVRKTKPTGLIKDTVR